MIPICGLTKTTLFDYPEHIASVLFLGGCNFNCPYCHNQELIYNFTPQYSTDEILSFLQKRSSIIEGVCITGGEPTIHHNLIDFITRIKQLPLKVKLDTNGTNPNFIQMLLEHDLIDYIAMDIKNSVTHYSDTVRSNNYSIKDIQSSISLIQHSGINYEFRTTYVQELHTIQDVIDIAKWLNGCKHYYLQNYKKPSNFPSNLFHPIDKENLLLYKKILSDYIPNTSIRGETI